MYTLGSTDPEEGSEPKKLPGSEIDHKSVRAVARTREIEGSKVEIKKLNKRMIWGVFLPFGAAVALFIGSHVIGFNLGYPESYVLPLTAMNVGSLALSGICFYYSGQISSRSQKVTANLKRIIRELEDEKESR